MFAYCNNCPLLFSDPSGYSIVFSPNDSDEDIEEALTYLRRLSNDIIIVVDNQLQILSFRQGGHAAGTQMLRELILSNHTVTINSTTSGFSQYTPHAEYVEVNGRWEKQPVTAPVGGVVSLNFGDKRLNGESRAMVVGHELIHAWRFSNSFSLLKNPNEIISRFNCILEEVYTVGLDPINYYSIYCENALRREHGLSIRTLY